MAAYVAPGAVALLEEDPELGAALTPAELEEARRLLVVPLISAEIGWWDLRDGARGPTLGVLLLEGLVTVNVALGDRTASHLAGPGDVLNPAGQPDPLLPADLGHMVSDPVRAAVLDRRFIAGVRRWPALLLALHERLRLQEERLAVHQAIGGLRRVEDRVLALMWHLAERWGRVTPAGVVLPLSLTHEAIGRLCGAQRSTVTLALGELARTGDVHRREDGAFILRPDSRLALAPPEHEMQRLRPLAVAHTPPPVVATADPAWHPTIDRDELLARVAAMREELPERTRGVAELIASSRASMQRSREVRARIAAERAQRAAG